VEGKLAELEGSGLENESEINNSARFGPHSHFRGKISGMQSVS
jgi:hypothetical protein